MPTTQTTSEFSVSTSNGLYNYWSYISYNIRVGIAIAIVRSVYNQTQFACTVKWGAGFGSGALVSLCNNLLAVFGYKHLLLWFKLHQWYVFGAQALVAHPLGVDLGREEVVGALCQASADSGVGRI